MSKFHYMIFTKYAITDLRNDEGRTYNNFHFCSTDGKMLDWLCASVEASSFKLGLVETFPSGQKYSVYVEEMELLESTKLEWWFLTQLGQMGWEPFFIQPEQPRSEDDSEIAAEMILLANISSHQGQVLHLKREVKNVKQEDQGK